MEWISKIIEAAKLPPKFILGIFLFSIFLLVLPERVLIALHIREFINQYGLYIGLIALASGTLILIETSLYARTIIISKARTYKRKKAVIERIKNLDPSEKAILREFFLQGRNTIRLPIDDPVVAGLLNSGVLSLVGKYGRMSSAGMLFSMKISDVVREHLTPELLELPYGQLTEKDIKFLKNNRPAFMRTIEREESLLKW